ncbi:IclR family transcriptional regulator [Enterococcus sp. AZ109]|uniref:IclR family transcriptional regulator n=1 Tax=Enterococcus sp. AZ109 TaxID=2774634 RepID=UPI003F1FF44A
MEEKHIKINHSLQKAFNIIEIMAITGEEMALNDISKQTQLPKATALRLIYTLQTMGYIQQNPKNSAYSLSLKFQLLANNMDIYREMVELIRPFMQEVSSILAEATCLSICDNQELVYIESIDSLDNLLNVTQKIGKRAPLYCTGAGKLYLSVMTTTELDDYLNKTPLLPLTTQTLTSKEAIKDKIREIQVNGYSMDNEECEIGVKCVALPVYDTQGKIVCTLSVSMPTIRATEEKIQQAIHTLTSIAQKIPV